MFIQRYFEQWGQNVSLGGIMIITSDSEVTMSSPGVCLCVCVEMVIILSVLLSCSLKQTLRPGDAYMRR